jgi:homogentisate 1,2-dioxygenase
MLDRWVQGQVAEKHHTQLRDAAGALLVEECLTRDGFRGAYTILYHRHRPQALRAAPLQHGFDTPFADPGPLLRRHFLTQTAALRPGPAIDARTPLLCNDDVVLSLSAPTEPDPTWFSNGDGDDLHFIQAGGGTLRSVLGDLRFGPLDYVVVPKGVAHRFLPDAGVPQRWLTLECAHGLGLPAQLRNEVGQLRMDAPYCHRDFRRPVLREPAREPADPGPRTLHVKRGGRFHAFAAEAPLDDCVGWDGTVYPFALPILRFQPRVGLVHLPPDTHATFAARGLLVCSFVPRPLDFHPHAVPCP